MREETAGRGELPADWVIVKACGTFAVRAEEAEAKRTAIAEHWASLGGLELRFEEESGEELEQLHSAMFRDGFDRTVNEAEWPEDIPHNLVVRLQHILEREHLTTVGDVLMIGRFAFDDIRGLGATAKDIAQKMLHLNLGRSITWLDEPTAADIARYCSDLSRVPAQAVDPYVSGMSVPEALDKLAAYTGWNTHSLLLLNRQNAERFRRFAEEFVAARRELEASAEQ